MASKPRLYLFHGNDRLASHEGVLKWQRLFVQKYGDVSRYRVEADECKPEEVNMRMAEYMQGTGLFERAKLLVVKRVTTGEQGPGYSRSKAFLQGLEVVVPLLSDQDTLVVWEDKYLKPSHPLRTWFEKQEQGGKAKVQEFLAPSDRSLPGAIGKWAGDFGKTVSGESVRYLVRLYQETEQSLRSENKVKAGEVMGTDDRPAWICQIVQSAALATAQREVQLSSVQEFAFPLSTGTAPFPVIQSALQGQWKQVYRELERLEGQNRDSGYYAFIGALRWTIRQKVERQDPGLADAVRKWALEWELVAKNFPFPLGSLTLVLMLRWQEYGATRTYRPLFPAKRLLQFHYARS